MHQDRITIREERGNPYLVSGKEGEGMPAVILYSVCIPWRTVNGCPGVIGIEYRDAVQSGIIRIW